MNNKKLGGLWGLLIGDAVGVPYEFQNPEDIPEKDLIDMVPPKDFERSWSNIEPGTWSDDGSQALTLLNSLILNKGLNLNSFTHSLFNWCLGYMWIDDKSFDMGSQTRLALYLHQINKDYSFLQELNNESNNGNGSLMRCLPIALYYNDLLTIIRETTNQSYITHPHIHSVMCCTIYNVIAYYLLQGIEFKTAYSQALKFLKDYYSSDVSLLSEYNTCINWGLKNPLKGSGYVLDSLHSSLYALWHTSSYTDAIKFAIAFGNDTDTTACITGGLAGIIYGFENISKLKWYEQMRGKEIVNKVLSNLS